MAVAVGAGVSDRNAASREEGVGTASLLVRLQVAHARECSLAELLGDISTSSPEWLLIRELLAGADEAGLRRARPAIAEALGSAGRWPARRRRVALVGLRGAGKCTLGSWLAEDLGLAVRGTRPIQGAPGRWTGVSVRATACVLWVRR